MQAFAPSQVINLLLIVVLVPVGVVTARKLTHPGRSWMLAGYLGIAAADVPCDAGDGAARPLPGP